MKKSFILWCHTGHAWFKKSLYFPHQVAEERLSNMRTVRAFVQEEREQEVYNQQIDNVLNLSYKEALARGIFWATVMRHFSIFCVYFQMFNQNSMSEHLSEIIYSFTVWILINMRKLWCRDWSTFLLLKTILVNGGYRYGIVANLFLTLTISIERYHAVDVI